MSKYQRYQDYVIKDGKLVGEFEEMYRDFDDPWEQTTREAFAAEKMLAVNTINALNANTVIEYGCGFGTFTQTIKDYAINPSLNVVGVDISETAIKKAQQRHPHLTFEVGDILDKDIIKKHKPEIIIFSEITWYILEKFSGFLEILKKDFPNTYFIHLLNFYPEGEQKYGVDYFTNLDELMRYADMNYLEYGEVTKPMHGNCRRSYFVGRYNPLDETYKI